MFLAEPPAGSGAPGPDHADQPSLSLPPPPSPGTWDNHGPRPAPLLHHPKNPRGQHSRPPPSKPSPAEKIKHNPRRRKRKTERRHAWGRGQEDPHPPTPPSRGAGLQRCPAGAGARLISAPAAPTGPDGSTRARPSPGPGRPGPGEHSPAPENGAIHRDTQRRRLSWAMGTSAAPTHTPSPRGWPPREGRRALGAGRGKDPSHGQPRPWWRAGVGQRGCAGDGGRRTGTVAPAPPETRSCSLARSLGTGSSRPARPARRRSLCN